MKKLIFLLMACLCISSAHAAYLRNIPMTLTQPDGTVLQCFASGDEFFNYLHDANGFTIMRHPKTGYFVYADKRDGKLVATEYIAGQHDPSSKGLQPYALISPEEWIARRKAWEEPEKPTKSRGYNPNHGTLNNIAIFIRFSDDPELTNSYAAIDNMFNNMADGAVSMKSYFKEASYGAINIPTTFYPGHNDDVIISYQDTYPRSYFEPYDASSNPNGYTDDERAEREFSLLERAVNYINDNYPIPSDLNIDYDDDGLVDNVCFIVKGGVGAWSSLLWPHKWALQDRYVYMNSKRVWTFNFQLADASSYFNASVMCHEMNHSLGAPDLYHYYNGTNLSPVGGWDLMENNAMPPQHCGAYMKMKYGHWVDEIPEITQAGTYTLNPISSNSPTNIAYKIQSEDPDQYYVLEYRDKTSFFESSLPGSGLLIYRIDTRFDGNAGYDPNNGVYDEVYLFRPGGSASANGDLSIAHFSASVGRDEFSSTSSAYPFYTGGAIDYNFRIYNITAAGSTISFSYGTSSDCDAPTNLAVTVANSNVTLTWDAAANAQSYNIYRNGILAGNTSSTSFTDSSVPYGQYKYFLKSVDANGLTSAASEYVTVTIVPEGYIFVGDASSNTENVLPSYNYYNYSLTQQIYTAAELGEAGMITNIAFYNGGGEKTRKLDLYLKTTGKNTFAGSSDWETMSEADRVFKGDVIFKADEWTFITLDLPFNYDGTSNLVLVADDNTGSWSGTPHMSCRVFNAPSQALRVYNDNDNYNPTTPSSYIGTVMDVKNQLLIAKMTPPTDPFTITVSADPSTWGTVSGGGEYYFGETCTVSALAKDGYRFVAWKENDEVVSMNAEFSFVVVQDRNLVAQFEEGILIGDGGNATDQILPSYSYYNYTLSQQIYTADEIGTSGTINSIAFYNGGSEKTRTYDMYLVHTTKTVFNSNKDWITVTENDKVFSGSVTMVANEWTVFILDTPFNYDGTSNLALIMDDNTGTYSSGMKCRVFDAAGNQTIRIYSDGTNYNPLNPSSYDGRLMSVKNQIILGVTTAGTETQTIDLALGWNWVSFNLEIALDDLKEAIKAELGNTGNATIKTQEKTIVYKNGNWVGTGISELDVKQMYEIKVSSACEFNLSGTPIKPEDFEITINHGANWIGFTPSSSMTLTEAFQGLSPVTGDVVKSKDHTAVFKNGNWLGNDLQTLEPGMGYVYQSKASGSKTFTYPSSK